MTISTETIKSQHSGNDVATSFVYAFRIFDKEDLEVTVLSASGAETTLILDTDYTVTGVGNDSGTVEYPISGDPLATGDTITIVSAAAYEQETDLENASAPFQETHEAAFDYMTRLIQQVKEKVDRAYVVSVTSSTSPEDLLDDLQDAVDDAVAAQTAAELAQDGAETAETNAGVSAAAAAASAAALPTPSVAKRGLRTTLAGTAFEESDQVPMLDVSNEWTTAQNFNETTLASGASITWDLSTNQAARLTLSSGASATLSNASNQKAGGEYQLDIRNSGAATLAFHSNYKFPGGVSPTITATADAIDILTCRSDGTYMYCNLLQDFS